MPLAGPTIWVMDVDLPAAVSLYIDFQRGRGASLDSLKTWRGHLRELVRFLGEWPAGPEPLMRWQAGLTGSRTTAHHKVKSARAFFIWAARLGYAEPQDLTIPRRPKRLPQVLDDDQLERLLGPWTPEYGERDRCLVDRDRLIVRTLMLTGLRRGEICGLLVGDVDLGHRRVRVRGKGEKDRVVPLPAGLRLETLCAGRAPRSPLFTRRDGGKLDREAVSYVFTRKVSPAIGCRVTPHMLRHSYATYLCRRGVPLRQIQLLLGHESLATTQIYLDITGADLEQAVAALDRLG